MESYFEMGLEAGMHNETKQAGFFGNLAGGLKTIGQGAQAAASQGAVAANRSAVRSATKAGTEGAKDATANMLSRGYQGMKRMGAYNRHAMSKMSPEQAAAVRKAGYGAMGIAGVGTGMAVS